MNRRHARGGAHTSSIKFLLSVQRFHQLALIFQFIKRKSRHFCCLDTPNIPWKTQLQLDYTSLKNTF